MSITFETTVICILARRADSPYRSAYRRSSVASYAYVDLQRLSYTHGYASEQTSKSDFHSMNGNREQLSPHPPIPFKVRQCRR